MASFKDWPNLKDKTIEAMFDFVQYINRTRDEDISVLDNFPNIYMSGRKVGKIPTGSADVVATDRIGDFNYDANYLYLFVTGAVWRRIALGVW